MRYLISRQWSMLQDFDITGESGDLRYQVRGNLGFTRSLTITDPSGQRTAQITRTPFSTWHQVTINGQQVDELRAGLVGVISGAAFVNIIVEHPQGTETAVALSSTPDLRAATISGSHAEMMAAASSRSRHVRTVRSDSPVYRTRVATDGNAPVPSGPAWFARPTSTNLHALDGWPPRSAGTGARFSAHEIASTLTADRPSSALPRPARPGA